MNLLTVRQAAELLGVHQNTIRNWITQGRLTAHRIGPKLIRINAEDLEQLKGQK
jgi:excisionase family DNA binding protein